MAGRYHKDDLFDRFDGTDGGEATPRPLKSRRLVDLVEGKDGDSRSGAIRRGQSRETSGKLLREADPPREDTETVPPLRRKSTTTTKPAAPKSATVAQDAPRPAVLDLPPDIYAVLSVTPSGEGETVTVVMAMPRPEEGKPQRVSFRLLVEQYAELGVKVGEISPARAEELLEAGRLCGAIRRGIAMLGYGDQSARRLAYKLTAKWVDRAIADAAVAYLTAKGYIHEDSTATLRAEQGLRKGWGARRIREDLCTHGFTREAVEEAMEALSDVDWAEACTAVLRKRYGEIPVERGERQKLMAAMMRLGFEAEDIRTAMGGFAEEYDGGDFL